MFYDESVGDKKFVLVVVKIVIKKDGVNIIKWIYGCLIDELID